MSLKSLTDHQLDTTASVGFCPCDEGVSEFVPTALIQTIQRTAVNSTTESQQSFISMPRDLYRKSTKMYECSKKSEGEKKQKKIQNMITFFCFIID